MDPPLFTSLLLSELTDTSSAPLFAAGTCFLLIAKGGGSYENTFLCLVLFISLGLKTDLV
jgi:hypothetical protein